MRVLVGTTVLLVSGLLAACQPGGPPASDQTSSPRPAPGQPSDGASPTPPTTDTGAVPADAGFTLTVTPVDGGPKTVTLRCHPSVQGDHPKAESACGDLAAAGGDPARITEVEGAPCTREYLPVTVTVSTDGRQTYAREFSNRCVMLVATRNLFDF